WGGEFTGCPHCGGRFRLPRQLRVEQRSSAPILDVPRVDTDWNTVTRDPVRQEPLSPEWDEVERGLGLIRLATVFLLATSLVWYLGMTIILAPNNGAWLSVLVAAQVLSLTGLDLALLVFLLGLGRCTRLREPALRRPLRGAWIFTQAAVVSVLL